MISAYNGPVIAEEPITIISRINPQWIQWLLYSRAPQLVRDQSNGLGVELEPHLGEAESPVALLNGRRVVEKEFKNVQIMQGTHQQRWEEHQPVN